MPVAVHAIIPVSPEPFPDLQRICRMQDGALRNLLITQRYHELSLGLRASLGWPDANWPTFATWASKTAGNFIRNEHVPGFMRKWLETEEQIEAGVERFVAGVFGQASARGGDPLDLARAITQRVNREIAGGNLKVFQELAPLFASFNQSIGHLRAPDEQTFLRFCAQLRPGPTPLGGQDALGRAFRSYYDAKFTTDRRRAAQLILLGNGLIGLHEQTRLQPNIKAALDAPVEELFGDKTRTAARLKDTWKRFMTRTMMTLAMPGGEELELGEDVPSRCTREFPRDLLELDLAPLVELVFAYDRDPSSLAGSAAKDWSCLHDRMNFIVDLFRSHQQLLSLFAPPFREDQRLSFEAGRMPTGEL